MKLSIGTFILLIFYAEACLYTRVVRKPSEPKPYVSKIKNRRSTFKYNISYTTPSTTLSPLKNATTGLPPINEPQIRNCTKEESDLQNCRTNVPCKFSFVTNGTHEIGSIYCLCPPEYSGPRCHLPGAYTALSNVGTGLIAFAVSAVVITIFVGILFVFLYKKKKAKSGGSYNCNRHETQRLQSLESQVLNGKSEKSSRQLSV